MPYRFSATTGNIVRPIESLCLNTSTGALNYPMRYQSGSIPMWNGVIEFYSTFTRYWPTTVYSAPLGFYTNEGYAYDEQGDNPGIPITDTNKTEYTTATWITAGSEFPDQVKSIVYRIAVPSGQYNLKIVWSAIITGGTLAWGGCYADCGNGAYVTPQSVEYTGQISIAYSLDNNSYTNIARYSGTSGIGGSSGLRLNTVSDVTITGGYVFIRMTASDQSQTMVDLCSGPSCGGTRRISVTASAEGYLYAVCAETV